MSRVAIIEKSPSKNDFTKIFDFDFDILYLTDNSALKTVLKKDITLDLKLLDKYNYIICVGADPVKHIAKQSSVLTSQGYLVAEKYIPLANPAMLAFKPEGKNTFYNAVNNINNIILGETTKSDYSCILLDNEKDIYDVLNKLYNEASVFSLDCETTALYPLDGYTICISFSFNKVGYCIQAQDISEEISNFLQKTFNHKKVVFHNSKFDMKFLGFHFGWKFPDFEDTMLMHYCFDERPGTHGLKDLAIKYTDLGNYDSELEEYKKSLCRTLGIKLEQFTYDLIPMDILYKYACKDAIATLILFDKFYEKLKGTGLFISVYERLLKAGTKALMVIEQNGVPFSKERLYEAKKDLDKKIAEDIDYLYNNFPEVKKLENNNNKIFNPNSVVQLRDLLFNYCKIPIQPERTETGEISLNAEVMTRLSAEYEIAKVLLRIRKNRKIKGTYIDNIINGLDSDNRLRTSFNLHTTLSGRLSSSGKLNMQQLPRDNKMVKRSIKARDGWVIINQDLKTAEMYIASVLSDDKVLQNIFVSGGDYHGFMAVYKYGLSCHPNDVAEKHPDLRQSAKTISFEILYKLNLNEEILQRFPTLKNWLRKVSNEVINNGFTYQFFGRKRRVPNVFSNNKQVAKHEVRSAVNALVQGPSSDVNLLAAIEMVEYIQNHNMKSLIFALVHDSIIAEVPLEEKDEYCRVLKQITQKDRGLSIEGFPIGVDVEIGEDYSFK